MAEFGSSTVVSRLNVNRICVLAREQRGKSYIVANFYSSSETKNRNGQSKGPRFGMEELVWCSTCCTSAARRY